jgi:hypothetical protein
MPSSGIICRVALVRTGVSEERSPVTLMMEALRHSSSSEMIGWAPACTVDVQKENKLGFPGRSVDILP